MACGMAHTARSDPFGGRAESLCWTILVTSCSRACVTCITRTPGGAQPGSCRTPGARRWEWGKPHVAEGTFVRGPRCRSGLSARAWHAQMTKVAASGRVIVLRTGAHGGAAPSAGQDPRRPSANPDRAHRARRNQIRRTPAIITTAGTAPGRPDSPAHRASVRPGPAPVVGCSARGPRRSSFARLCQIARARSAGSQALIITWRQFLARFKD